MLHHHGTILVLLLLSLIAGTVMGKHHRPEGGPFSYLNLFNKEKVENIEAAIEPEFAKCKVRLLSNNQVMSVNHRGDLEADGCPRIWREGFQSSGCISSSGINILDGFEVIGAYCYIWLIEGTLAEETTGPGEVHEFSQGVWSSQDIRRNGFHANTVSYVKIFNELRYPVVKPICGNVWHVSGVNGGYFQIARNPGFFPAAEFGSMQKDPPAGFQDSKRWQRLHFHQEISCGVTTSERVFALKGHLCPSYEHPMLVYTKTNWRRGKNYLFDETLEMLVPMESSQSPDCLRAAAICRGHYWIENTSPVSLYYSVNRSLDGEDLNFHFTLEAGAVALIKTGLGSNNNVFANQLAEKEQVRFFVADKDDIIRQDKFIQSNIFPCGGSQAPGTLLPDSAYSKVFGPETLTSCGGGRCPDLDCVFPTGPMPETPFCQKEITPTQTLIVATVSGSSFSFDIHAKTAINITQIQPSIHLSSVVNWRFEYKNCSSGCSNELVSGGWKEFASGTQQPSGAMTWSQAPGLLVKRGQRISIRGVTTGGANVLATLVTPKRCCGIHTQNDDLALYFIEDYANFPKITYCSEGKLSVPNPIPIYDVPVTYVAWYQNPNMLTDITHGHPNYFAPFPEQRFDISQFIKYHLGLTAEIPSQCCNIVIDEITDLRQLSSKYKAISFQNSVPDVEDFHLVDEWFTPDKVIWGFGAAVQYLVKAGYLHPEGATLTSNVPEVGRGDFWQFAAKCQARPYTNTGGSVCLFDDVAYLLEPFDFGTVHASVEDGLNQFHGPVVVERTVPNQGTVYWAHDSSNSIVSTWTNLFFKSINVGCNPMSWPVSCPPDTNANFIVDGCEQ